MGLALLSPASSARGQVSPARPVRFVIPYAPGGPTDGAVRAISDRLSAVLGQPIVVENRSGGLGTIGAGLVAGAAPDGQTVLADASPNVVNASVLRDIPFDYRTAFAPVTQLARVPIVLVAKTALPVGGIADFLALARRRPDPLSCGNAGNATASHLAAALLQRRAGLALAHVPYRGGAEAGRDLAAGSLDCAMLSMSTAAPLAQAGRARPLAVTGAHRSALMPELPTLEESGVAGAAWEEWSGLFLPAGAPAAAVDRLAAAAAGIMREPEVRQRYALLGAEPVGSSPGAFAEFLAQARLEAGRLVREAGIELN
jgi:tripartite-type tricarboxylate transporter receptor subunit TctC